MEDNLAHHLLGREATSSSGTTSGADDQDLLDFFELFPLSELREALLFDQHDPMALNFDQWAFAGQWTR